ERQGAHVDAVELDARLRRRHFWRNAARRETAQKLLLRRGTELLDARHYPHLVVPRAKGLHQQPVRFIAAAMRRIVKGILRQQDAHYFDARSRNRCKSRARRAGERWSSRLCGLASIL